MVSKADKLRLRKLLLDAISLVCRCSLPVQSSFCIEATIGITLSKDEVVLVNFCEVIQPYESMVSQALSKKVQASNETSSILSHVDDLNGQDKEKAKGKAASNRPSQVVHSETRDKTEDESGAGNGRADFAFIRNSGIVGNLDNRIRSSVGGDIPNCSQLDADILSCDESHETPRVRSWCSSNDRIIVNDTSLLDRGNHRSQSDVQIKDGVVDDENCMFVTTEEGGSGTTPGGGVSWSGLQQRLPVDSRSQVMVKDIIKKSPLESSSGRYLCHICRAQLRNILTLRSHVKKTHLALKIDRCRTCGAAFRWSSQLARHKKREHGLVGTPLSARGGAGWVG